MGRFGGLEVKGGQAGSIVISLCLFVWGERSS